MSDTQKQTNDVHPMDIAMYQAVTTAWCNSMLERDKSVLTLGSAGLAAMLAGLLTLSTAEKLTKYWWLIPAALSLIYFFACILQTLRIFRCNAEYLEKIHQYIETDEDGAELEAKKRAAEDSLALGIFFAVVTGIVVVWQRSYLP